MSTKYTVKNATAFKRMIELLGQPWLVAYRREAGLNQAQRPSAFLKGGDVVFGDFDYVLSTFDTDFPGAENLDRVEASSLD